MQQHATDKTPAEQLSRWQKLWRSPRRWYFLWMPAGGMLALLVGLVGAIGFTASIHMTNENEFCYSCHVGMDSIVEEYQASIHFKNETGIAATCADCHVPKAFLPKMWVKIKATKDIYHQLAGTYNLQNFEEHRLELAQTVWDKMQQNQSEQCRSCHDPEAWDIEKQPARARTNHNPEIWAERQESCIDCHYGIAHKRPTIE